jgi:hypothetical protein
MEQKSWPWLSYINVIALVALILLSAGLIFFGFNGMLLGFLIATYKTYLLAFIALVFIGFSVLLIVNYSSAKGKSGWLFMIAAMIFLPISLCLIGLAFSLLYIK